MGSALQPDFYARDTARVARELLGCRLETRIRGARVSGRIVEVEAYVGPHDAAAHGYQDRKTTRNAPLFGPPGTGYAYFIYGMYWCFNAVTERDGYPAAVLIRALEPIDGVGAMRRRRGIADLKLLCSGPGRLCQALGITGTVNGLALDGERLRIVAGDSVPATRIGVSPRIGISRAADWPLRFYEQDSPWLSRIPPRMQQRVGETESTVSPTRGRSRSRQLSGRRKFPRATS